MKKILVTERQLKLLQEEGWQYSPEKIDEFVEIVKRDLDKATKIFNGAFNAVIMLSIGEIMDDTDRIEKFQQEVEKQQRYYESVFNKYYDIVEMYDWMDRPDNVTELSRVNEQIDSVQNDLYKLYNSIEEIVDNVKRLKSVNPHNEASRDDQ